MTPRQLELIRAADAILAKAAQLEAMKREEKGLPARKSESIPWNRFVKTPFGGQPGYRRK